MQANKNHTSLETAKLLKDCGVKSKSVWVEDYDECEGWEVFTDGECIGERFDYIDFDQSNLIGTHDFYPAFTWQEILWEHADLFFGNKRGNFNEGVLNRNFYTVDILKLLQAKEYDNADQYFRKHCILIKI